MFKIFFIKMFKKSFSYRLSLVLAVIVPLLVGFLGSIFTDFSIQTWYVVINKPFFNPPNWIFALVWTILFVLMWVASFWVLGKARKENCDRVLWVYTLQLFLNFLWSVFFFGLQSPLFGLINIILLWVVILRNIRVFYKVDKKSGLILLPYLLWVSFATILNLSILILN